MAHPVLLKLTQGDDETNLDFGLRKSKAKRDHRKALRRWREQGGDVPAPTAEAAEPEEKGSRLREYGKGLRGDIEETMKQYEQ